MGKLSTGILGPLSGRVGPVVGGNWKGIDYVRSYVVPANPNTADQQTQRGKFSYVQMIASSVLALVIQPFWNAFATAMSGYNLFMRTNLNLVSDTPLPSEIVMAQGTLESTEITVAGYDDEIDAVTTEWPTTCNGNGLSTDTAHVVIYDTVNNVAFIDSTATRADGTVNVSCGDGRTPANLQAWLFFSRGTGSEFTVSNSDHIQVVMA